MDIQTAHQIIVAYMLNEAPKINDYSVGSVAYTITRGVAVAFKSMYDLIETLDSNYILGNSTGTYLTDMATTLGYERLPGNKSIGYVLVSNPTSSRIDFSSSLVLTDPVTTLQFTIRDRTDRSISSYQETRIPISSIESTSDANLAAGTELISGAYPNLSFIVGQYRTTSGEVYGDLTGGRSLEADESLRERIIRGISNISFNNATQIERYLLNEVVKLTSVRAHTIGGGAVTVWVSSNELLTASELEEINSLVIEILPPGIQVETKQTTDTKVDFKVKVYTLPNDTLTAIQELKTYIRNYINSLDIGAPIIISDLTTSLTTNLGYPLTFIYPISDQYVSQVGEVFHLGEVEVSYNV